MTENAPTQKKSFTQEQLAAINSRAGNILVSAAAGSGKTAVLIERILSLVTEEGLGLEQLLVVTFTDNAASEMKERLQKALALRLEQLEHSRGRAAAKRHIMRQLAVMPSTDISTIHSFCLRLVRENFHLLELDPNFRIGDVTELALLQSQVMEELFEEEYETNPGFAELAENFGGGKTKDYRLDILVRRMFELIEGSADPAETAARYLQNASVLAPWLEIIYDEAAACIGHALALISRAKEICMLPGGPSLYLDNLDDDEAVLRGLNSRDVLEAEFFSVSRLEFGRLYTYRGKQKDEIDAGLLEAAKDLRKRAKAELEAVNKLLGCSTFSFDKSEPVTRALLVLTLKYRDKYSAAKRARGLLDFNDLEHFAVQVLWTDGAPSPVARTLCAKYKEIMTDEYQDTSEVQELILSAISRTAISTSEERENTRFMVGDIKQSIYGFRRAKPGIFLAKSKAGELVLSKNFRSSLEVIETVNFLFERLMSDTEISYDSAARLIPGITRAPDPRRTTELHVLQLDEELEDDKLVQEAKMIARRIHKLTEEGYKHSDIVILVRGLKSIAEDLTEALKQENINAMAQVDGGFFKTPEVMLALSVLRVADNPRQDIDLLAVLRLFDFTPDELLTVRLEGRLAAGNASADFYECLTAFADFDGSDRPLNKRAADFLANLAEVRNQAAIMPISRLLGFLYERFGLLEYVAKMPGGAVREANLRLLTEKAIAYEETSFSGLFHFVRYMEWLQEKRVDESPVKLLPGGDSVVQVMTIHKSKGLEFPVVFVSRLGTGFSDRDEKQHVILHPELGIGAKYTDLNLRIRTDTIARQALRLLTRNERIAEELRVLYVALTRAEKKLILTGTSKDLPASEQKWQNSAPQNGSFSEYNLKKSGCFLDFIMPCVLEAGAASPLKYVKFQPVTDCNRLESAQAPVPQTPEIITKVPPPPYRYEYEAALPSKLAISELKRIYALETTPESHNLHDRYEQLKFQPPAFLDRETAVNMGTLIHTAVEHIDLNTARTMPDIEELLANLTARALITEEEAALFGTDAKTALLRFAGSELAARMRKSKVYREVPFVMGISPHEVFSDTAPPHVCTEKILVHGIIDCYFIEESGRVVLVDFKSGRQEGLEQRYATQMAVYRRALEEYLGRGVDECLFYGFYG